MQVLDLGVFRSLNLTIAVKSAVYKQAGVLNTHIDNVLTTLKRKTLLFNSM